LRLVSADLLLFETWYPFRHGYRRATFPKGTAFGGGDKVSGVAIRRPLEGRLPRSGEDVAQRQKGESGCERSEQTEGVKPEKAAAPYGVQRLSLEENEELVGMKIT
jgi:hypothetical protein